MSAQKRVWTPQDLAAFLCVSVHWIYKRTATGAVDAIPRIQGMGVLRFDTHSSDFKAWMKRRGLEVDESNNGH